MPKDDYMPNDDGGKARLFTLFRDQIGAYLDQLEIAPDDPQIIAQAADATRFKAVLEFVLQMQHSAKAWTAMKDFELEGKEGVAVELGVPVLGPDFPPAVPPGIVRRFRRLAKWIKARPNYHEGIGKALGIEGRQITRPDLSEVAPVLALRLNGGRVEILWTWRGLSDWCDMLRIEVDRSDGLGWVPLTVDTSPGSVDPTPLPAQPKAWKYRGRFYDSEFPVGEWSAPVSINVGG